MQPKTGRVVISSGQSESSVLELVSETIVGVYMPSAWDAADVGFGASYDNIELFGRFRVWVSAHYSGRR